MKMSTLADFFEDADKDRFEFRSRLENFDREDKRELRSWLEGNEKSDRGGCRDRKDDKKDDVAETVAPPELDLDTSLNTIKDIIATGLEARGIDVDEISVAESTSFELAAYRMQSILESDIETSEDVDLLFSNDLNVIFVDNFATTEGAPLKGAAIIETNEIILDSAVEGDELRETLIEEVAATAYHQAFDSASTGDFGAGVLAGLKGEEIDEASDEFAGPSQADTVQTDFGTAEAYEDSQLDPLVEAIEATYDGLEVTDITFSLAEFGRYTEYRDATGGGTELTFWNEDAFDAEFIMPKTDLNGEVWDFDQDGNGVESVQWFFDAPDNPTGEIVSRASEYDYIPIDGLTETWVANGTSDQDRLSLDYTEGESFTTGEETSWSDSVATDGTFKAAFGDFELTGGITRTSEEGASVSTSNTITTTTGRSLTSVMEHANHLEDTGFTVGQHEQIVDVGVETEYDIWIAFYESSEGRDPDAYIKMGVRDTRVIEDYLMDIVYTQHETDALEFDPGLTAALDAEFGFV